VTERERLVAVLDRARRAGNLDAADEIAILDRYDRGDLALPPFPLERNEFPTILSVATIALALTWAKSFSYDQIVAQFESSAQRYSRAATGDVGQFEEKMSRLIQTHIVAQHALGARTRVLLTHDTIRLTTRANDEWPFLADFGDELFADTLRGARPAPAAVYARARLYAGSGMAQFWIAREANDYRGDGWVVDYIARDDGHTCAACAEAAAKGPYPLGEGPMPGVVCYGRGRCRCAREVRRG
jgi:hypothetical protein